MKIKNRTIQLFLISLGLLLILSTYFLYPRIAGENKTSNLVQDKKTLNKLEKELTDKDLKKIEEELANLMNIQRPKIQEELAKANSINKIEEELDKLKNIQAPIIEEELANNVSYSIPLPKLESKRDEVLSVEDKIYKLTHESTYTDIPIIMFYSMNEYVCKYTIISHVRTYKER